MTQSAARVQWVNQIIFIAYLLTYNICYHFKYGDTVCADFGCWVRVALDTAYTVAVVKAR